jgi:LPS-assembly protein
MTSGRGSITDFMLRFISILVLCFAVDWLGAPAAARAQTSLAGCTSYKQQQQTGIRIVDDHWVLDGTADAPVKIECDNMLFFADHVEYFQKEGRVTARGHVVYASAGNRISAERMEFNTRTRTGTFYVASGTATLQGKSSSSAGPLGAQEPDLMFRGDEIHKIGPKKYRIVGGNFTTCVQPTPRWEMQSRSITLNLDDYALIKNALLRVKHVPLFYLPIFYFPIQEDDRATGFVMPIYGSTTSRGQSISNAFFWAINRSQDATFMHDWFSKAGQQMGGEYRYILSPGSQGSATTSFLKESPRTVTASDGSENNLAGQKTYTVVGGLVQQLPLNLRLRSNANYYSSIVTQQRYQQDIYQATNSSRRMDANISGSWNSFSLSTTVEHADYFNSPTSFSTTGALPRVNFSRGERKIGGSPLYFGMNSELVTLERSVTTDDVKTSDRGLSRVDVSPSLRVPFTRWPFLTVNSSVAWRGTYWTESLDAGGVQVAEPISRKYFDFQTRITGPVLNRIWNTPGNGYAEKFKHVVQPTLTIQRVTAVDNFDQIVRLDGTDTIVGSLTRLNYGVANRLYAKKDVSREILSATLSQSYYTDARAAQYETQNQTGFGTDPPSHYGPVTLQVRGMPTDRVQADFRTEWDTSVSAIRTLALNGGFTSGTWLTATAGWSQRRYIPELSGYDNPAGATNYLNASADLRRSGGRLGTSYAFNYDLQHDEFLQQRYSVYYNAQCCGIAVEYQTFNYAGGFAGLTIPQDKRFNLSFTLAGIGTFSNLFGAFGGQSR